MATKVYSSVLGLFLRDLFKTKLDANLGAGVLQVCMFGDLEQVFYPRSDDAQGYASLVPAVFVQPESVEFPLATLNQRYETPYLFRCVYVDVIAEGGTHESNRLRVEGLADAVLEDYRLAAISGLTQAQVKIARVVGIEYRPPEDLYVASLNAQLTASVANVRIELIAWNL